MSTSRPLLKLGSYKQRTAKEESYGNPGLPETASSIGATLDYIIASLFPNAKASVDTELDLPGTGNTINDYRIVRDYNSTGQSAGYRWTKLEGQASPQWNLVQLFDSQDSILQQWEQNASGLYVNQNGQPGGQTIHGSTDANENLTLSPNSGDGSNDPASQTGYVETFGSLRPTHNNQFTLGSLAEQWSSLYLAGMISDGVNAATVEQLVDAYEHSLVTSGNPHNVDYEELINRIGNLTINGDVSSIVVDLSTNGNKTATLTVTDDSHNHTVSTITDYDDATWAKIKAALVDTTDVTWTFDDVNHYAQADISIDTSSVSDMASPAADKLLAGNALGDAWEAIDGAVELTGNVTGSGSYSSTDKKITINTSVDTVSLDDISEMDIDWFYADVQAGTNPAQINTREHGLETGDKIRLIGTPLGAIHTITKIDATTFTIPVDYSGGTGILAHYIPHNAHFSFNADRNLWEVAPAGSEISHHQVLNLTNSDDHTQYVNKNGRGDGTANIVTGAELANGNLILQSTTDATRGSVLFRDNATPENGAVYSTGTWNGTDLGTVSRPFRDIHIRGELKGGRAEQLASLPTPKAEEKGRIVQLSDGKLYINKDGASYVQLWEKPSLVGQAGKALVVSNDETTLDFTEVEVIATNALSGEESNIGTTVVEISAPANAIGVYLQADEANPATLRFSWGTDNPTVATGVELLQGEREYFRISGNLKVIAESGTASKLSYTWSIK